jgi:hypothetical protein
MDALNINIQSGNNKKIDKGDVIIEYQKYKGFLLPIAVIIASVLIFLYIVIPEIKQFSVSRQQLEEESQKLESLKNNYNFLQNIDEEQSQADLKLLVKVLPQQKDFLGIMTAVSAASAKSGLSLSAYNFSLGNLSKVDANSSLQSPIITMNLIANGNGLTLSKFLLELYKTVPLAEIEKLDNTGGSVNLILNFFYKPFLPSNLSDDKPIIAVSNDEKQLLLDLKTWNNLEENTDISGGLFGIATPSAILNSTASSNTNFSPFQ